MNFSTFIVNGKEKFGVVNEQQNGIWDVEQLAIDSGIQCPPTLLAGITAGDSFIDAISKLLAWGKEHSSNDYLIPFTEVKWLSPIPKPTKNIMCVGKNYRDHAIGMGGEASIPKEVMVFTKSPTSVTGHNEIVESHEEITSELDYEGELAVIIGKKGRGISKETALDYVFGYTILNDITARDLQQRHQQFFIGKSLDTSCPIGPWIVHKNSINNPNNLQIETRVNGEIRQKSNTEHFIFPLEEVISVLSQGMTLEPGDIIATGTPAGVGKGFNPPRFLKSGDEVEITIEKIGRLNNIVK